MEKRGQHTNSPNIQPSGKYRCASHPAARIRQKCTKKPLFFEELFCILCIPVRKTPVSGSRRAGNRYMPTSF
ncbi:hypothetical protein D3Z48_16265 [Clostridiaceae bacterium]|nr:hypothetical protein [Clostridiaceae bacterium]